MSTTQQRLDAYLAAEAAVLKGQSYQIGDQRLEKADLAEIRRAIASLRAELARENGPPGMGGLRYRTAVFNGGGG
jgi:hypothetical protein